MIRSFLAIFLLNFLAIGSPAQHTAFGPKGGFSLASQNYNGFTRDIRLTGHAAFYVESLTDENKNSLFAQVGYHPRGSAIQFASGTGPGGQFPGRRILWRFHNAALALGAKQKFDLGATSKWYFAFALRGEYNVKTQIDEPYANLENLSNKFVFGLDAGAGIEMMWSELIGALVEVRVSPDVTSQLFIPAQPDPFNPNRFLREKEVRNLTIELSVGLRLLRIVEYED